MPGYPTETNFRPGPGKFFGRATVLASSRSSIQKRRKSVGPRKTFTAGSNFARKRRSRPPKNLYISPDSGGRPKYRPDRAYFPRRSVSDNFSLEREENGVPAFSRSILPARIGFGRLLTPAWKEICG